MKKHQKLAMFIAVLTMGAIALPSVASASKKDEDKVHKSYVCKYVGTPGVDERLQTGQNPIWVDNSALTGKDDDVKVGDTFSDKHGKSVVIVANTGKLNPEPDIDKCPAPDVPESTTSSTTSTTVEESTTTTEGDDEESTTTSSSTSTSTTVGDTSTTEPEETTTTSTVVDTTTSEPTTTSTPTTTSPETSVVTTTSLPPRGRIPDAGNGTTIPLLALLTLGLGGIILLARRVV